MATSFADMANILTAEQEIMILEYHAQAEDSGTQTTGEDFLDLERMRAQQRNRDTSVQTTGGNFSPLKLKLNTSTQTTDNDFYLLENTREASTQTIEDIILQEITQEENTLTAETESRVVDQVIYEENNSAFLSESSEQRKLSVDQLITHDRDSQNPSRLEIIERREEVNASFREQGDINPDLRMDTSAASNHIAINKSCLTEPKSWNKTEPYSDNEEMQKLDSLFKRVSIIEQTTESNMNVSENDSDSEVSNEKAEFSVDNTVPSYSSVSL